MSEPLMPMNDEPEPTVTWLGDVQRLHLGSRDILVLTAEAPISQETAIRIREHLHTVLGKEQRVLVMDKSMSIGVLVREEIAEEPPDEKPGHWVETRVVSA